MKHYALILSFAVCTVLGGNPRVVSAGSFETDVLPVLKGKCLKCHGASKQNGDVRLDTLSVNLIEDRSAAETWHDVLGVLNRGEMPPKNEPALTESERSILVGWLTQEFDKADKILRSTGGQTVLRRLNRVEYQNTMRDLLGLNLDYVKNLPPDELSVDGFRNNGSALRMSSLQLEYHLQTARLALRRAIVEGPAPEVFEHSSTESATDKIKANYTNRLGRSGVFVVKVLEFPDEGEFEIRIKARAEIPDGAPVPQMQIMLGFRADTQTPSREIATLDVKNADSREFVFRGRIEEFPLQSRTQSKYPGLLIWIRNTYTDGKQAPRAKTVQQQIKGKKSKQIVWEEDTQFPKIVIESVAFKAPVYEHWPPEHHTRLLPSSPGSKTEERQLAEAALRQFVPRAYRRPVEDAVIKDALQFFEQVRPTLSSYEAAMRETFAMILISPDFLYLVEPTTEVVRPLDDFEIASRLSYFLWSTMPDERLFRLAQSGKLIDPKVRRDEVTRMLTDPKSWEFVEQFCGQWLDLDGIDRVAVNPEYYPDFDLSIKRDMRKESEHFFAEVLYKNLSAVNFLDSDFAMLNAPLARHYGIEGPRGTAFEKVMLKPEDRRGGVLTHAGILLANSTGEDSHPIERGVWVRDRLFNDPPPPPPANVPALDKDNADFSKLSLKEQLIRHRENAACADCHRKIDPWGIPLEEYDAIGLFRTEILCKSGRKGNFVKQPVDAAAELPDGQKVDGIEQFKQQLLINHREQFARALVERMLTYALGRTLEFTDEQAVDRLTAQFLKDELQLAGLVASIVASEEFSHR